MTTARKKKHCFYHVVKRVFDIMFSVVGIILLIPITIIIGLCIKIEDHGPIFFKQQRIGKNGKPFNLIKFRSMKVGAEAELEELLKGDNAFSREFKDNEKVHNDHRITKIGKFIRKTSIDELPQLLNVFAGKMSMIGPRPLLKGELERHRGNKEIYWSVRPGITGWWGCNGRSSITNYKKRLELEYYYVEHMSFWLDVKCFFLTVKAVFVTKGAK